LGNSVTAKGKKEEGEDDRRTHEVRRIRYFYPHLSWKRGEMNIIINLKRENEEERESTRGEDTKHTREKEAQIMV
jgi:hypothetical protein